MKCKELNKLSCIDIQTTGTGEYLTEQHALSKPVDVDMFSKSADDRCFTFFASQRTFLDLF